MTFCPWGGRSSAEYVHDEAWLDFNVLQSGHTSARLDNRRMVAEDYGRKPAKPCLDGEPAYEDHPDMRWERGSEAPYFDDAMVRRLACQAVFADACGHTYGCHAVWQFFDGEREAVNRAHRPWRRALRLPGAEQICVFSAR